MEKVQIDLRELESSSSATIKIPRKKKLSRKELRAVDPSSAPIADSYKDFASAIASAGGRREDADHAVLDDGNNLKPLGTIEWGVFNIERIIDLIIAIERKLINLSQFPLPYQEEPQRRIIRSVLMGEGAKITILQSRQSGKSFGLAGLLATLGPVMPALAKQFPQQLGIYKDGFRMGIYAPSEEQAKTIYEHVTRFSKSESAMELYADVEIDTGISKYGNKWENGSFVFCQSASPRSNIEGKTYDLVVLDETQDLEEYIVEKSIYPMASWNNGTFVHIGTCTDKPTFFKPMIEENLEHDKYVPTERRLHYRYDYEHVMQYNPRYAAVIEDYRRRNRVGTRHFRLNYGLEWLDEEANPIKKETLREKALRPDLGIRETSNNPVVIGIDIAKETNSTVVTVSDFVRLTKQYTDTEEANFALRINDWFELEKMTYTLQAEMIGSFLAPYTNIAYVCVDSTGVGNAVIEILQKVFPPFVTLSGVVYSPKSKHSMMELFFELLEDGRLLIPADEETKRLTKYRNFILQMVNVQKVVKGGLTVLEKRSTEGSRDDYVDSFLLMCEAARRFAAVGGNPEVVDSGFLFGRAPAAFSPPGLRGRPSPNLRKERANKLFRK